VLQSLDELTVELVDALVDPRRPVDPSPSA
jgi:hypothetical protein